MKLKMLLIAMFVFLAGASLVFANDAEFNITADVPEAVDVGFFSSRVVSTPTIEFTKLPGSGSQNFDFGTLTFDSDTGTFTADHFYAIDVGAIDANGDAAAAGGKTFSTVSLSYGGDSVPAGATAGLSTKALVTYVKVAGTPQTETVFERKLLGSVVSVSPSQWAGGFLRMYVGISTGQTTFPQGPALPTHTPFISTDVPGTYSGTLNITATLLG